MTWSLNLCLCPTSILPPNHPGAQSRDTHGHIPQAQHAGLDYLPHWLPEIQSVAWFSTADGHREAGMVKTKKRRVWWRKEERDTEIRKQESTMRSKKSVWSSGRQMEKTELADNGGKKVKELRLWRRDAHFNEGKIILLLLYWLAHYTLKY